MEATMGRHDKLIEHLDENYAKDQESLRYNENLKGPQPPDVEEESTKLRDEMEKNRRLRERADEDND
jgi:hypothetical protein